MICGCGLRRGLRAKRLFLHFSFNNPIMKNGCKRGRPSSLNHILEAKRKGVERNGKDMKEAGTKRLLI